MTLRVFGEMVEQIGTILKLESGEEDEKKTSLSGDDAFRLGQRIFSKGKK